MNDRSEASRARCRAAGDQVLIRGRRFLRLLDRIELERKFNQFWLLQPRVPAGQPDGGQWTDGDVTLVNSERSDFRVSLRYNDLRWGGADRNSAHTIDKHVGVSDAELVALSSGSGRLATRPDGETVIEYQNHGSFSTIDAAEAAINEALQNPLNKDRLRRWLRTSKSKTEVNYTSPSTVVGRVSFLDDDFEYRAHNTNSIRIIIRRDPKNPTEFYVETAFPTTSGMAQ